MCKVLQYPPLQRIKGGTLRKTDKRKCTISHIMMNIYDLGLNMLLPYFKANDVHHFYGNLLRDIVTFIEIQFIHSNKHLQSHNHQHNQDTEYFYHSKNFPLVLCVSHKSKPSPGQTVI